jgi:hypothetical protein
MSMIKDLKAQFNFASTRDRIALTDTTGRLYRAAITKRLHVPYHEENWGRRGGQWVEETTVVEFVVAVPVAGEEVAFVEARATRIGDSPWRVFPRQFQLPPTFSPGDMSV